MTEIANWTEIIGGADARFLRRARPPQSVVPDTVILGMPHLCTNGLSEIWLLKELGHRHWFLLAEAAGQSAPDFRDENGSRVYAAFRAVSIAGGDFSAAAENDLLSLTSRLLRVSRTQVESRHSLAIDGRSIGTVGMVSTFIRRDASGSNRSVARIAVDGLPAIGKEIHRQRFDATTGSRIESGAEPSLRRIADTASFTVDPCPSQDFNGAGLLYFTSFIAFVDRAEWRFDRSLALTATTIEREVIYRGNTDPGETLRVVLFDVWERQHEFGHCCRLERVADNTVLADIRSVRRVAR